jgi:hypothetical protein
MIALPTISVEVSEEAAQHIEQCGLQEPFQRMLDEIPRRFQAVQWIKVGLEHIVDEAGRPVVAIDVARVYPGRDGDDPSGRQFGRWVTETFAPEIWQHFGVMNIYVDAHAG